MLRDEEPYTEETAQRIVQRFKELLPRIGKSMAWASRSLAIPESTLSEVLSLKYAGDLEDRVRKIDKWTENQILREAAPKPAGFVKTGVVEDIYHGARIAQESNGISVVTGPAGCGKTMALLAMLSEFPASLYVSVTTVGASKVAMMDQIARALRVPGKLTSLQCERAVIKLLEKTNRMIFIDEMHKLVGRRKDEALHAMRDLHDHTLCPMVWCGMPNLAAYIRDEKNEWEPLDQVNSRIVWWVDLKAKALGTGDGGSGGQGKMYTLKEIRDYIGKQKIRITPDGEKFIMQLANKYGAGHLRICGTVLRIAQRAAARSGRPIDAELLASIRAQQTGRRDEFEADEDEHRGGMTAAG